MRILVGGRRVCPTTCGTAARPGVDAWQRMLVRHRGAVPLVGEQHGRLMVRALTGHGLHLQAAA
eukprot:1146849-Pelagomonas_calceolata.AAC.5